MLENSNAFQELPISIIEHVLNEHSIVTVTDSEGVIIYANDKLCEISKYSRDELIGQTHRIIKSGHHDSKFYGELWKTISSGKTWKGEIRNRAKDRSFYWVKTTIMPIFDSQKKISHYISIRTDITENKELQDKLLVAERLSSSGKLSGRMSHDMKNPLGVIRNSVEILKIKLGEQLDEDSKKFFNHIDHAIDRISNQIDDVLDFVRKSPLKLQKHDISEIIHLAINELNVSDDISINVNGKPLEINCDSFQIEIVFKNLIKNAIDAVQKGKIDINYSESNENVIIEVIDSGQGIHDDVIGKIFEPLFTTKQKGTGLGLTSVKNIIEAHRGTISVKNNPTTFTITLPKNI